MEMISQCTRNDCNNNLEKTDTRVLSEATETSDRDAMMLEFSTEKMYSYCLYYLYYPCLDILKNWKPSYL